jgi:response regulator RpfG family c-di-GMP phosphodiesterase
MDNIQKLEYDHSNLERKKKIMMICDDNPDTLLLSGLVLESRYNLIMVDSGEECIDKYIKETTRGWIMNWGGMSGDSVARKIKECYKTKIILNSAYNVDDVLIRDIENGNYISRYIQKPFDTDRLTDLVAEMVKN